MSRRVSFAVDVFIDIMLDIISCNEAEELFFCSVWLMHIIAFETPSHRVDEKAQLMKLGNQIRGNTSEDISTGTGVRT